MFGPHQYYVCALMKIKFVKGKTHMIAKLKYKTDFVDMQYV